MKPTIFLDSRFSFFHAQITPASGAGRRQGEKYERMAEYSLDRENRKKYAQRAQMWEKQVENAGVSGIMESQKPRKLASDRKSVVNPMNRERYMRMRNGLERQGIMVLSGVAGDDLRYLLWYGAEAMAQSATHMMHIGETPSASAFFEEIIHIAQYRIYGDVDAGDFLERAAREVAANRKLLANKDAYGFDEIDTSEIQINLKIWEEDFIRRAGVSYDESEINRDV